MCDITINKMWRRKLKGKWERDMMHGVGWRIVLFRCIGIGIEFKLILVIFAFRCIELELNSNHFSRSRIELELNQNNCWCWKIELESNQNKNEKSKIELESNLIEIYNCKNWIGINIFLWVFRFQFDSVHRAANWKITLTVIVIIHWI